MNKKKPTFDARDGFGLGLAFASCAVLVVNLEVGSHSAFTVLGGLMAIVALFATWGPRKKARKLRGHRRNRRNDAIDY